MKTLGLIGGTSWVSTAEYYKLLNQMVTERLGGYNAARLLLHSVNFAEYKKLADERNTAEITRRLVRIAQTLEGAGAEAIVLCANTMHLAAAEVRTSTGIRYGVSRLRSCVSQRSQPITGCTPCARAAS